MKTTLLRKIGPKARSILQINKGKTWIGAANRARESTLQAFDLDRLA